MVENISARHQLPLLATGQAQKEVTHNEALIRIDALLHPVVEAELATPPTITAGTQEGKCWLIANAASGEWLGHGGKIAYWTGGSWRLLTSVDGMFLRNKMLGIDLFRTPSGWIAPTAIANPAGGGVIDAEARTALNTLLTQLRLTGVIAT